MAGYSTCLTGKITAPERDHDDTDAMAQGDTDAMAQGDGLGFLAMTASMRAGISVNTMHTQGR